MLMVVLVLMLMVVLVLVQDCAQLNYVYYIRMWRLWRAGYTTGVDVCIPCPCVTLGLAAACSTLSCLVGWVILLHVTPWE